MDTSRLVSLDFLSVNALNNILSLQVLLFHARTSGTSLNTLLWKPVLHCFMLACVHVLLVLIDAGQLQVVWALMCLCDTGCWG